MSLTIFLRLLRKYSYFFTISQYLLGLSLFVFGALYLTISKSAGVNYPFDTPKIRNAKIIGKVIKIDLIKQQKISLEIELLSLNNSEIDHINKQKFVCNLWRDTTNVLNSIYEELKIGNIISFISTVSRAKNQRNPGEFDYEDYLLKKGIYGTINCYKIESVEILNHNADFLSNIIFKTRRVIDERIKLLHNSTSAALLKGILLADRSDIDYDIRTSFVNSGVIHVLAVSGLHVGFISVIFFLILSRVNIRVKYILTIFGIILFLIITGGHSSVFRASTMAIVYIIAKLTNRSTNGFNSISIAALIILLINPNELFNPGFLLSFSAVISILVIYPIISKRIDNLQINGIVKYFALFISVSLAAQLGTLSFTLVYFNKLSLISLLANVIVIPAIGFIVSIGILTLLSSIVSVAVATIFASANIIMIDILFYIVQISSNISYSFLPVYNFSILDSIIFYAFLSIILLIIVKFKNKLLTILSILILSFSMINFMSVDNKPILPSGKLSIVTIDVGQGDSFLTKFPNQKTALIDAGEATEYFDNGDRVIYPLLKKMGVDKINYAFLSHMDSDHFAGFISLVEKGIIDTVYKPFDNISTKDRIFEEYLDAHQIGCLYYANQSISFEDSRVYFLNDTINYSYKNFDSNNKSGIIKIVYGKTSFLFVGDAEIEAEEYLVERYADFLDSDVLKVGHHGSKSSSSDEFLDLVNPQIGIISAGVMNRFKHPSERVVSRLVDKNIDIRRTDHEGAMILVSDGESIKNIDWRK
jgi:competence protein ComEC